MTPYKALDFHASLMPLRAAGIVALGLIFTVASASAASKAKPSKDAKAPQTESHYSRTGSASSAVRAPGSESSYWSPAGKTASASPARANGKIRVAMFADPESTGKTSRRATMAVLAKARGITAQMVTTSTVRSPDFFDKFDVLVLPGGSGGGEAAAVGVEAGRELSRRVKAGKGIVAVCAGGYYVAKGWNPATKAVELVNAENHDADHWARGEQFIAVKVLGKDDKTTSQTIWYENGPIFKPGKIDGLSKYVPLVRYESDLAAKGAPKGQMKGRDAVIAARYGKGRVVAFGPHPERTPALNHWLVNAIKWAAGKHGGEEINAEVVLEGR